MATVKKAHRRNRERERERERERDGWMDGCLWMDGWMSLFI